MTTKKNTLVSAQVLMVMNLSQTINKLIYLHAYPFQNIDEIVGVAKYNIFSTTDFQSSYEWISVQEDK